MNALASAVIGVPGKGECRGSKGACAPCKGKPQRYPWYREDLQRRMARRARYWQVRSVVTQEVNVIEAVNVNIHAAVLKVASGQLRFPGSSKGWNTKRTTLAFQ